VSSSLAGGAAGPKVAAGVLALGARSAGSFSAEVSFASAFDFSFWPHAIGTLSAQNETASQAQTSLLIGGRRAFEDEDKTNRTRDVSRY